MLPPTGGACDAEPTSKDQRGHGGRGLLERSPGAREASPSYLQRGGPPRFSPSPGQ